MIENKYSVEEIKLYNNQIVVLMKDLESNEYFEITEDTLQNKTSKTDMIIYKLVMHSLYEELMNVDIKRK